MSEFRDQAGNWSVVGSVLMNPTVDIHEPRVIEVGEAYVVEAPSRRKKRRRKKDPVAMVGPALAHLPEPVTFAPGHGILLNMNNDSIKDHLLTKWEHGDLLLELDVMMPKGSNSGIYLQGRYEVQLLDSWGVKDPAYGDIGGIYRNWETGKGQIYMGKAPLTNAAKAPGLWQHFSIAFQAPRFDAGGKKTANARFIYVDLNGVRIHENLEVPLPTGGPIAKNEAARGPLMIQGDHGPVAFRNIRYQLLQQQDLQLKDIAYRYFSGPVVDLSELADKQPDAAGTLPQLTIAAGHPTDLFAMVFTGQLTAPETGTYSLRLNQNGSARLELGGRTVTNPYRIGGEQSFSVVLQQGNNPFTLTYFKSDAWFDPGLGLFETGSFPRPLHAYSSFPSTGRRAAPIFVDVGNAPRLLRAFLDFGGDRSRRLTHTIGVGTPGGTHFIYDLKAGSPACVWRGEFINATPMWNDRGDGSFQPRGAVQYLFTGTSFARLPTPDTGFADELNQTGEFLSKGYRIDGTNGMPVFLYAADSLQLEDSLVPDTSGHALTRTISLQTDAAVPQFLYVKLAEGKQIRELDQSGIYVIDQQYYIHLAPGLQPVIRSRAAGQELIIPMTSPELVYKINW